MIKWGLKGIKMSETRLTKQKKAILSYLKSVYTHPTAEMIYDALKNDLPSLSLATVYRNLHQLAEQGQILQLEINNEFHFDGDLQEHQHGVCRSCGLIIDIFDKNLNAYALKKASNMEGFIPKKANIFFEGTCANCAKLHSHSENEI